MLERRGLHLIAAIRSHVGGYVPDFMTPGQAAGPRPERMAELHQVATTPGEVVVRQVSRMRLRRAVAAVITALREDRVHGGV